MCDISQFVTVGSIGDVCKFFLANNADPDSMPYFIRVFTVCHSTCLQVSRSNIIGLSHILWVAFSLSYMERAKLQLPFQTFFKCC